MSYYLMVFDPTEAPRDRAAFRAWYQQTVQWAEGHDYNDPANTTPPLQGWFAEIRQRFPNMNGPGAPSDDEFEAVEDRLADYAFASQAVYVAFPWSCAEAAYDLTRQLAVQHGVGFYDVSGDEGDGEIYFPGNQLMPPSGGAWREIAKRFRDMREQP